MLDYPLALEFLKSGYCVTGIDKNKERIESLTRGRSYVIDIKDEDSQDLFKKVSFA
ncbi:MAG: hypothetical protein QY310_01590 [Candidatus Jettenia sp. CY-1]|nr:MAG: hypothetical protein QY310_01590 [Candidatus Jettenia sp. CY-1]